MRKVKLAARVESLTKICPARILMTECVRGRLLLFIEAGTFGHVCFAGLEKVVVKGTEAPVEIFLTSTGDHGGETSVTRSHVEVVRLTAK